MNHNLMVESKAPISSSSPPPSSSETSAPVAKTAAAAPDNFLVVGIGGSAGSLEAYEAFFQNLPPTTGMAFVVIPHLAPEYKSNMVEILQRHTPLPVHEVTQDLPLEPDNVYVVTPHQETGLKGGAFRLLPPTLPAHQRLPIDFFFQSLARELRERAVAVILSGLGSDGTQGLKAIVENYGMVTVQEPETALFDSMPRNAIKTDFVDYVLAPGEMPKKLLAYANTPGQQGRPLLDSKKSELTLQKVFYYIKNQTGHDFSQYKRNTIFRRIERRMNLHQIKQFSQYAAYLKESPNEVELLFKEFLIGVTRFFRDEEAFEMLKHKFLPQLLQEKKEGDTIRVWVAGCSTGEEAYTLAILLQECIELYPEIENLKIQIFASDIDPVAIERARSGYYPENIAADVSQERLKRYFVKIENQYHIRKELRERVVFALHNVTRDAPFTKLDLLTCRNLLIYLSPELQRKVFPVFHYSLNPSGLLMLGSSETIGGHPDLFQTLDAKWKIYQRSESAVPMSRIDFPFSFSTTEPVKPLPEPASQVNRELTMSTAVHRIMLDQFAPPSVIVNAKGDIFYIHGRTGRYLEPAPGQAKLNIFDMAREGLNYELNNAIHKAHLLHEVVTVEQVQVRNEMGTQFIKLTVKPLHEPEILKNFLMVVFEEIPAEKKKPRRSPKGTAETNTQKDEIIGQLEMELQFTKQRLQTTVEEMHSSLEELKSTNEELQSANEELQSTNEESMTNKEEMQSLNEELMTINLQYQTKTEELINSNNDMKNLLDSTEIATIFLDQHHNIKNFTPQATQIFNLIRSDVGRSITHIASNLKYQNITKDVKEVLAKLQSKEIHIQTADERQWYSMRIMPYRTVENFINGAVLTFTNITAFKEMEINLGATSMYASAVVDMVHQPLVVLDHLLRVEMASKNFIETFKLVPEQVSGQWLFHLGNGQWDIPALHEAMEQTLIEAKELRDFELEHDFAMLGTKKLKLSTRRVAYQDNKTFKVILAIDVF
ncbi:CheR family methyltransferase [Rufibacter quisquiliarum]|uniref:protein-glutamate O-methyltransferase n=1 Tax=Rufibacter quisquiliarum TaxID=1549639 RepID=A0A839GWB3_9BACT|nr:CheR family methyltransferase [Rufibacter quisquiliarum]MBA9079157.1 two-component system CheB/CheR fusion protein [Rufibacter quisquiliarum]